MSIGICVVDPRVVDRPSAQRDLEDGKPFTCARVSFKPDIRSPEGAVPIGLLVELRFPKDVILMGLALDLIPPHVFATLGDPTYHRDCFDGRSSKPAIVRLIEMSLRPYPDDKEPNESDKEEDRERKRAFKKLIFTQRAAYASQGTRFLVHDPVPLSINVTYPYGILADGDGRTLAQKKGMRAVLSALSNDGFLHAHDVPDPGEFPARRGSGVVMG